jgi:hypothetical protein
MPRSSFGLSWVKRVFAKAARPAARPAARHGHRRGALQVEQLEARELLAVTATLDNGTLTLLGTDAADNITVRQANDQVTVAGVGQGFAAGSVSRIDIRGLGGDDVIDVRGVLKPTTIDGGAGADRFLIGLTTPLSLPGYDSADRVEFGDPGSATAYRVAGDGTVYWLTPNGDLYNVNASAGFRQEAGSVAQFAVGDSGATVFYLTRSGTLYSGSRSAGFRQESVGGNPTGVAQLAVGDGGHTEFALMRDGQVYVKNVSTAWGGYTGGMTQLAVGDGGYTTFLLAANGSLYSVNRAQGFRQESVGGNPTGVAQLAVGDGGHTEW